MAWSEELSVGIAGMDEHHKVFLDLLARLKEVPAADLPGLFEEFERHLAEHFAYEESLMVTHGFPALNEHRGEHQRVLAEARDMQRSLGRGRTLMVREFLRTRMPEWFDLHRNTMDMATAAFLRQKGIS